MYLEKLEIQGFKSFANKNELIFPGLSADGQRGITVVVGPNGSGKSNVADAIRWVMGEQSMKTLRGKKGEDVIFSGSDKRGRLGMAEVSLYFNNEDGQAPIDYTQVVITRRLYRDGASEYIINNSKVRLFDVQMLLAKANVGQKTYSVIGQGLVESFLNTSLSERKEFFDEATGVRQYQIKRDDSLNKLKATLENLGQSQMLLNEIEPRLKTLTRQVAKLEKREALSEELLALQKEYYSQAWQDLNSQLNNVNSKLLELEKSKQDKDKRIAEANSELISIEQEKSVSEDFAELSHQVNDWQRLKIRLEDSLEKLSAWLSVTDNLGSQVDITSLETEREKLARALDTAEQSANKWKSQLGTDNDLSNWQTELRNLIVERDRLSKEYERLDAWLEMKLEASGKFDLSFLNNRKTELTKALHESALIQSEMEQDINTRSAKLERSKTELAEIKQSLRETREELLQHSSVSQDKVVKEVSHHLEKSLAKLASVDRELDLGKIKIALAEVKLDLEKVLALSTGQELRQKITRLQDKITKLGEKQEAVLHGISQLNGELMTSQARLKLTREHHKQIEREIDDNERKLKKAEDKFDAKEVRVSQAKLTEQIEPIEAKMSQIRAKISERQARDEATRSELMLSQSKSVELRLDLKSVDDQIAQAKYAQAKQLARQEAAGSAIKSLIEGELSHQAVADAEQKTKAELADLTGQIDEAQSKLKQFNAEQERKRQHLLQLQRSLASLQTEVNDINSELNNLRITGARVETRLEDLETEIRADFGDLGVIKQYQPKLILDKNDAVARIKNLKHQLELIGGIDPEVEKEYHETKERFDFLDGQTTDLNDTIKSLEDIIKELDLNIKERFDKEFKIIEEKFQEYFKILFNGGNAKIIKVMADEMMEAEPNNEALVEANPEAPQMTANEAALKRIKLLQRYDSTGLAGIEIVATPPGKKIQSIAMLSGGERALTAIALICAIISANPSPFVVLDEVDAALDEANSDRLAKILEDLSHKTQFIVITHNRAPMRKAAILYGVTMGDDSVSKLLSVKLEDVKD